ncbi:hypothetical protein ZWY2020_051978 [Hordeum vulgare]|nr:hypothetical protein ZWY2020_051978 [Hordeum vulgare]
MSKFATSPPARNLDMSHVLDDAYDATDRDAMLDTMPHDTMSDTALPDIARDVMLDTARDAMPDDAMLDTARDATFPDVPLGVFLDAHIARVTANALDASETADTIEIEPAFAPARSNSPRYELPDIPEGYVMEGEIAEDFLACKDAYDVEKLLLKWKERSLKDCRNFSEVLKYQSFQVLDEVLMDKEIKSGKSSSLWMPKAPQEIQGCRKSLSLGMPREGIPSFVFNPSVEQVLQAQNNLLNELNDNSVRVITRGGKMTQEPLYPEGHPKIIDQDSQGINANTPSHPKEKKKDDRNLHVSSPNTVTPEEPNDISASHAETQSGDEHEPGYNMDSDVHNNAQPSNDEDVEIEPTVNPYKPQPKRYDKNDSTSRKHGKEREPWVQRSMPFPPKPSKKKDDEDFERFVEMIRPIFLQMRLVNMLKMSPYAKYMKDIVTNKRKIPDLEIFTMLANYTFKGGTPKKLGDPGVPTIPCSIKGNYIRTALCDLGAGVSVMPLSLYRRLELDKLTPTEISLQMADKSTAFPIGICEDLPVVVADTTILTDFVIFESALYQLEGVNRRFLEFHH